MRRSSFYPLMLAAFAMLALAAAARAQPSVPPPEARLIEKPNARVPLDLQFTDERGQNVRLADYFKPDRPVILSLVYYNCPSICNLTMNDLVKAVKPMGLEVGRDYQVVLVSFDPREKPELAAAKKASYMKLLDRAPDAPGWALLTTTGSSARTLGTALGFGYMLEPKTEQYIHQAGIYICAPDGRVARVIQGMGYKTDELHDSLVAASEGKISRGLWGIAQACGFLHYDAATGRYTWAAVALMRITALLTVLLLAVVIGTMVYRDARKKRTAPAAGGS